MRSIAPHSTLGNKYGPLRCVSVVITAAPDLQELLLSQTGLDLNLVPYALTASVVYWLEFLAANPEVPGSIPCATRFSE
jgi:hypothetical protein